MSKLLFPWGMGLGRRKPLGLVRLCLPPSKGLDDPLHTVTHTLFTPNAFYAALLTISWRLSLDNGKHSAY
jgi:hypothetical protein